MNMSVFSKYLEPLREANLICLTDDPKPSEIYAALRIAYNQGSVGVEYTTQMISPIANDGDDYDECYDIWECAQSESLKEWIGWVNRKITLQIGLQNYQTIGVRVRIATSMLNMLVQLGKVPDKVAQKIHYYLCNNVRNEITLIVNEELPFLGSPTHPRYLYAAYGF